jgi:5-formyltetrahydrofolate cyclo-ligase
MIDLQHMDNADKPALRQWAKKQRALLDMASLSEQLVTRLRELPECVAARHLLLYLAMPGEINVEALIDTERQWYVPRCAPKRRLAVHEYVPQVTPMRAGPFGIREPDPELVDETNPAVLDLVIVPALLFSWNRERLGYGGGYYDRFLPNLSTECLTIGVMPNALVMPTLPTDAWDIPLDIVLTERNIFRRNL